MTETMDNALYYIRRQLPQLADLLEYIHGHIQDEELRLTYEHCVQTCIYESDPMSIQTAQNEMFCALLNVIALRTRELARDRFILLCVVAFFLCLLALQVVSVAFHGERQCSVD